MSDPYARIAELEAALAAAHTDAVYGCLTRVGLEYWWRQQPADHRAAIFGDIDHMHEHNEARGYDAMDAAICAALAAVPLRQGERSVDAVAGRWYSGDELVWIVPERDAFGVMQRIALLEATTVAATLQAQHALFLALTEVRP